MTEAALSVLILAGGKSTRMGQDKAWMPFEGLPLVERVARHLLPLAAEILFSTNRPAPYEELAARLPLPAKIVPDLYPNAGPLAGLHAGLSAASCELLLALATDLPFVNLELIAHMRSLAAGYQAVVPYTPPAAGGKPQAEPLHAIYRRTCLPAIESHLGAGDRTVLSFFADVKVRTVSPEEIGRFDPHYRSFINVNTPADWARAQELK